MAHLPSLETQAKVASDAAEEFVNLYYESLNKRQSLAPYYASTSPHLTSASVKPDISINGRVVESVAAYEALLDAQGANVFYTIVSFDAHPVNPNYVLGCPDNLSPSTDGRGKAAKSIKDGDRLSFTIQVSGNIRYGKPDNTPTPIPAPATTTPAITNGAAAPEVADDGAPIEAAFNESWLLVPHWEALGRNAARGLRKWVVASQNFRAF
ncbi:nuclear transport factor 2 domain-containing protein [Xylaria venustula]|nr:nuclear transport factor 2 domain-containing protein [Xylaria venustula]